jgi:hypothetical protein
MNFYKEDDVHTSDNADYYRNVWDKGHLAFQQLLILIQWKI